MNIIVPIHLEALRVSPSSSEQAKTALYDFSLLGQQPTSAMGDLIASNRFQNAQTRLSQEPGIHLHWSVPKAYTQGVQDEKTGAVRYPVVPNRWLIIRYFRDNVKGTDNTRIRIWVLESDAHSTTEQGTQSSTRIPWMDDARDLQGIQSNFLGRKMDLNSTWAEQAVGTLTSGVALAAGDVGFLGDMFQATFGYGETFTAFYPNCGDVLGLWDTLDDYFPNPNMLESNTDFSASYAVMGWVNAPEADECNKTLTQALAEYQALEDPKPDFPDYIKGIVEQTLEWSLSSYDTLTVANAGQTQAVMNGILSDVPWKITKPGQPVYPTAVPSVDKVQVSVGNNTAEALSAYLQAVEGTQPGDGDAGVTSSMEWLLNALQFNKLQGLSAGDTGVGQLQEFLHGTGFAGDQGGYIWSVIQKTAEDLKKEKHNDQTAPDDETKDVAADNEITLPPSLARVLAQMNAFQRALDDKRDEIAWRRKQLFFDWTYHISQINTHVITGDGEMDDDNSGIFMADGLLQLFPAMLQAGNFVDLGKPTAPFVPSANPFNIRLPSDFPQANATKLTGYAFNTAPNAVAADFVARLMGQGVALDTLADSTLPDVTLLLGQVQALLRLYAAGGTDADSYIADANALLSVIVPLLQTADTALGALDDATHGLAAQAARVDAATAALAGFIDPATGVFATALTYQSDPGKAPLPAGETYTGQVQQPLGALMSWENAVGDFPGMKAQMDIFAGQNGQPQHLLDVQPAALSLGTAYFYANSGLPFKTAAAYYLQLAEHCIETGQADGKAASAALLGASAALAGTTLSGMQQALHQMVTLTLPAIQSDLARTQPDAAAALAELDILLGPQGSDEASLADLEAAARSKDWRSLRAAMNETALGIAGRIPLAQRVAIWNQFLEGQTKAQFNLQADPANYYFRPTEPVVLLAEETVDGNVLAPFNRNGTAPRLPCRLVSEIVTATAPTPYPPQISGLAAKLTTGIAGLADTLQSLATEALLLTPEIAATVMPADLAAAAKANEDPQYETVPYDSLRDVILADPPAGLSGKLPYYVAYNWRSPEDPFLPLFIWWESDYQFSQAFDQSNQSYPPGYLGQFELGQYDVELQPDVAQVERFNTAPSVPNGFTVHGLISLSSSSTSSLCNQIQLYCQSYLGYDPAGGPPLSGIPDYDEALKFYTAYEDYKARNVLSQGLSGFNPGMVQRSQELQIPITIPKHWTDSTAPTFPMSDFWATSFLHDQSDSWPVTWNDEGLNFSAFAGGNTKVYFNPLRAGFMNIDKISLVDSFGRFVDLPHPNPAIISQNMQSDGDTPADHDIYLAPRLVQPARVNFEWIAAEGPSGNLPFVELGDQPAASPVCGWVWPNHLDDSLMLYDAGGAPMGSLRTRQTRLHWFPVPGETTQVGAVNRDQMLAYFEANLANPVFRDFVADYLYPDETPATDTRFQQFLTVLRKSQQFIVTAAMQQDQALGALMGNPMVLTQTAISLTQKGLPYVALDQQTYPAWDKSGKQFTLDAAHYIPYNPENFNQAGIPDLEVPVRIGTAEVRKTGGTSIPYFDDGVVGYFLPEDLDTFYTPVDIADSDGITSVAKPGSHPLRLTPNGPAATLTTLMDPRAAVHATTGLLPVKSLKIPADQYSKILDQLEITFLTAPLLVSQTPPAIPLPAEKDFSWSWVEVGADAQALRPAQGVTDAVFPTTPQHMVDGWLKLQKRN